MARKDRYVAGEFCWAVLGATGAAEAKTFYSGLFGWTWRDVSGPRPVSLAQAAGQDVVAMRALGPDDFEPPRWMPYVAVDSVGAAAARCELFGGGVVSAPAELGSLGRAATIEDPAGATIGVWESGAFSGTRETGVHGAPHWFENNTPDIAAAERFYGALFGWTAERSPSGVRTVFRNGETRIASCLRLDEETGARPHWLVYFRVDDCLAAAKNAEELMGCALVPPMETPEGRFAVVEDPQGAVFAIIQPRA